VQNKLHWAVSGRTAAELIAERADPAKPNMGLTAWSGAKVRRADVTVAKNYLNQPEIAELNRTAPDTQTGLSFVGPRTIALDLRVPDRPDVKVTVGAVHLWTFAGGQSNHTLKCALELTTGWKVVADNLHLRIEGAGITHATLDEAVQKLRAGTFWSSAENQQALFARSPDFRLSKFQQALPPAYETEVVSTYLLDLAGAERFLNGPVSDPVIGANGQKSPGALG
jgi:hypothetical protein